MDDKISNYILIAIILIVVLFFFKGFIMNIASKLKALILSFIPDMSLIYI